MPELSDKSIIIAKYLTRFVLSAEDDRLQKQESHYGKDKRNSKRSGTIIRESRL
jgi:hypothetical protein